MSSEFLPWQIQWSWSKKTRPGRMPWSTAEQTTATWSPSRVLKTRYWSRRKSRMPPPLTSGWGCATPARWASGSGSLMRASVMRTGPRTQRRSVTYLEPWTVEDDTNGSAAPIPRSSTSYVLTESRDVWCFSSHSNFILTFFSPVI